MEKIEKHGQAGEQEHEDGRRNDEPKGRLFLAKPEDDDEEG